MWKTAVNCRLTARRLWVQSPTRGLARSLNAVAVLAEHWVPQPASSHCPKTCKWGELETPNWQLGKDGWDWLQHTMWPRVQWKWEERIIVMMLRTGHRDIHPHVHLLSGQFRRETMCVEWIMQLFHTTQTLFRDYELYILFYKNNKQ